MQDTSDLIRIGLPIVLFVAISATAFIPATRALLRSMWRAFARVTKCPWIALAGLGVVAAVLFAIPWMFGQVQDPAIHDEFSYLLAADTFRHFRLTNPTPADWQAFQTMHVLLVPTYMSKFPPAQGMVLAAGWLLGSPRLGVIVAGAVACVTTAWMLRARMSWRWSLLGGAIAIVFPTTYEWTQNFWGGSVAMCGGALFCGAMLRAESMLVTRQRARSRINQNRALKIGIIAGVGLAILANSRPFEGVLFALILGALLTVRLLRKQRFAVARLVPFLAGSASVLLPVAIWMGYYNYRVTGDALRMPYAVHAEQYMVAPVFWWQPLQDPKTEIPHIAGFHKQFEFREYERQTTFGGFFENAWRKLRMVRWMFFWPLIYYPALIGGGFALWRWRSARFAIIVPIVLLLIHMACTPWMRTHYLAPIVPLWIMFVLYAIRGMALVRLPNLRWRLPRRLPVSVIIALLIGSAVFSMHTNILAAILRRQATNGREIVLNAVQREPGKHIIFVFYTPGPQHEFEWVTNGADLVNAPVLWVHMRTPELDMQLVNQYPERNVWMLSVENEHFELRPVVMRHSAQSPPP